MVLGVLAGVYKIEVAFVACLLVSQLQNGPILLKIEHLTHLPSEQIAILVRPKLYDLIIDLQRPLASRFCAAMLPLGTIVFIG